MREFKKLCCTSLIVVLVLLSGTLCSAQDTLSILHISDTHVIFNFNSLNPALKKVRQSERFGYDSLRLFFNTIPKEVHASDIIITGDLVDFFEAETAANKIKGKNIEGFKSLYDASPVPLYLTLGNHDLQTDSVKNNYTVKTTSPWSGIVESQVCAKRARAKWIRTIPRFFNGTYYLKVFNVDGTKFHFFFLDNGYHLKEDGKIFDKTQLDWLNAQMLKTGNDPVVLFFHIYLPVGDINGDGIYFKKDGPVNWPDSQQCTKGFLKILNSYKNIKAMFVGHGHRNVFEKIHFPSGHNIYQIETGALKDGTRNWRLCRFTKNSIIVSKNGSKETQIIITL